MFLFFQKFGWDATWACFFQLEFFFPEKKVCLCLWGCEVSFLEKKLQEQGVWYFHQNGMCIQWLDSWMDFAFSSALRIIWTFKTGYLEDLTPAKKQVQTLSKILRVGIYFLVSSPPSRSFVFGGFLETSGFGSVTKQLYNIYIYGYHLQHLVTLR